MHLSLSLFHCDTPDGNRAKEKQFQWFVVSKGTANDLELLSEPQLEGLLASARENPYDNRPFAALAKLLETSLGIEAYEFFVDNVLGLPSAIACFFENFARPNEISVDFQGTKTLNYPKYRVYKFASFLDLLCPGHIYWRGQVDPYSMEWAETGLRRFQAVADGHELTAILQRWIKQPGRSAFSEKRAKRSKEIRRRHEFLLTLQNHLAPAIVAHRLDNAEFKSLKKYPSYTVWQGQNPKSFASWLSRQYAEAENSFGKSAQSSKH